MKRMFRIYASALLLAGALSLTVSSFASARPGLNPPVKEIADGRFGAQKEVADALGLAHVYDLARRIVAKYSTMMDRAIKHEAVVADGGLLCRRERALYD